jgi:hypothetical protein
MIALSFVGPPCAFAARCPDTRAVREPPLRKHGLASNTDGTKES